MLRWLMAIIGGAAFLGANIGPLQAQIAQSNSPATELLLGPLTVTQAIQGVQVNLVSRSYISLYTSNEGLNFRIRVIADLGDLQAKIGAIIDTFPLPRDNCRSFSANNPVVTIWGKELKAVGSSATLWLHGHVDVWDCRENPVPNTKVDWRIEEIKAGPLKTGVKTKVPVVVTWPGNPIKNHLGTQPFDISEPINLIRVTDNTIALQLGDPDVHLGGQYVSVTKGLLSIAGIDVNAKARDALRQAIDPSKLQVSVPPEIIRLNPKVESATFEAGGNALAARITLTARVPVELVNEVISRLVSQLQNKKP